MTHTKFRLIFSCILLAGLLQSCFLFDKKDKNDGSKEASTEEKAGRLAMFIGMDISGSYVKRPYFGDSLDFLSHYIYAHLKGYGKLEIPYTLFVGAIGGEKIANEPKTFYPIQTFQDKSIAEIRQKLVSIFPKNDKNVFTDFNAFFRQVASFVQKKNLVLRPVSIVLVSDGIPDVPKKDGKHDYRTFDLSPLETLTRNITIRLIYTTPEVANNWQTKVKRNRVKVWTQDATVMKDWQDPHILIPGIPLEQQTKFFTWIKDNVDFNVRLIRVD